MSSSETRLLNLLAWDHTTGDKASAPCSSYGPVIENATLAHVGAFVGYIESDCDGCDTQCRYMYDGINPSSRARGIKTCTRCKDALQDLYQSVLRYHPDCRTIGKMIKLASRAIVIRAVLRGHNLRSTAQYSNRLCNWCMLYCDSHDNCEKNIRDGLHLITTESNKLLLMRAVLNSDVLSHIRSALCDLTWPACTTMSTPLDDASVTPIKFTSQDLCRLLETPDCMGWSCHSEHEAVMRWVARCGFCVDVCAMRHSSSPLGYYINYGNPYIGNVGTVARITFSGEQNSTLIFESFVKGCDKCGANMPNFGSADNVRIIAAYGAKCSIH